MSQVDIRHIQLMAEIGRKRVVEMDYASSGGHIGGSLSCMDIIAAIHHGVLSENDIYLQSKGHCAEALYVMLAQTGKIDDSELDTYCAKNSRLYGHPTNHVPGILINTGALGHGLSVGVGVCIGKKRGLMPGRCYVLLGDGELGEGSNFEAMAAAAHYKLDNLVAVVDRNKLQISGPTEDVLAIRSLEEKAAAYGWHTETIDGHDVASLIKALGNSTKKDKPLLIIANTIKGKGVSFMEENASWHHGVMTEEQYRQAVEEICAKIKEVEQ